MQHTVDTPKYLQSSETFTPNNIVVTGSPSINSNGVMSNLSNSDYVSVPTNFASNGNWECVMCVKPYSTKTAQSSWTSMDDACVLGIPNGYYGWVDPIVYTKQPNVGIFVTTNGVLITINKSTYSGDSTNVGSILRTDITFSNSQFYDIKVEFTGSAYNAYYKLHSASSWTSLGTISSSNTIGECALNVGYTYQGITGTGWIGVRESYFNGEIDLFNSYIKINGNYFWMNKNIIQSGLVPQLHSVDTMKYLKKTGSISTWIQPILSANGTLGGNSFACSANNAYGSGYIPYYALDGVVKHSPGNYNDYTFSTKTGSYFTFYNPEAIKISQLILDVSTSSAYYFGAKLYASNDNSTYTYIADIPNTQIETKTISINNNNYYKYWKITDFTGGAYPYIGEITITATTGTETWSAGTSSNYTLKKPLCHSVNVPKYLKKTTTSTAWTQPILSANGTLGGNDVAVWTDYNYSGTQYAYSAFNYYGVGQIATDKKWYTKPNKSLILYSPAGLNITNIQYTNGGNQLLKSMDILVSNDNNNYTNIKSYTSTNFTNYATINIPISHNGYYKYIKFYTTESNNYYGETWIQIQYIKLTATTQTQGWQAGTSSNYDLIK